MQQIKMLIASADVMPVSAVGVVPLCQHRVLLSCSHKKKRMQQIKKLMQRGLLDPEQEDPFSLFVASTNIRYCYYSETHKILGNTFGMCVLQVRLFADMPDQRLVF